MNEKSKNIVNLILVFMILSVISIAAIFCAFFVEQINTNEVFKWVLAGGGILVLLLSIVAIFIFNKKLKDIENGVVKQAKPQKQQVQVAKPQTPQNTVANQTNQQQQPQQQVQPRPVQQQVQPVQQPQQQQVQQQPQPAQQQVQPQQFQQQAQPVQQQQSLPVQQPQQFQQQSFVPVQPNYYPVQQQYMQPQPNPYFVPFAAPPQGYYVPPVAANQQPEQPKQASTVQKASKQKQSAKSAQATQKTNASTTKAAHKASATVATVPTPQAYPQMAVSPQFTPQFAQGGGLSQGSNTTVVNYIIPEKSTYDFIAMGEYQSIEDKFTEIAKMDQTQFVIYVAKLFSRIGYGVKLTPVVDNFGIDMVVERNGIYIAVGVIKASKVLSAESLEKIAKGVEHYNCQQAIALTNMFFDKSALDFAKREALSLVDRAILVEEFMN